MNVGLNELDLQMRTAGCVRPHQHAGGLVLVEELAAHEEPEHGAAERLGQPHGVVRGPRHKRAIRLEPAVRDEQMEVRMPVGSWRILMRHLLSVAGVVVGLLLPPVAVAQSDSLSPQSRAAPGQRRVAITAGFGNMYGGSGLGGELYFAHSRLSVVAGVGGLFETSGHPGTFAAAGALRGYTPGHRHRGFLELSVSLLDLRWTQVGNTFTNVMHDYGLGLVAGYHYTASGGFTLLVGAGAGWAPGPNTIEVMGEFGIGYCWR